MSDSEEDTTSTNSEIMFPATYESVVSHNVGLVQSPVNKHVQSPDITMFLVSPNVHLGPCLDIFCVQNVFLGISFTKLLGFRSRSCGIISFCQTFHHTHREQSGWSPELLLLHRIVGTMAELEDMKSDLLCSHQLLTLQLSTWSQIDCYCSWYNAAA